MPSAFTLDWDFVLFSRLSKKNSVFCTSETLIAPLTGEHQGDHFNLEPFLNSAKYNDLNAHILILHVARIRDFFHCNNSTSFDKCLQTFIYFEAVMEWSSTF